jgi:hypothetical protein
MFIKRILLSLCLIIVFSASAFAGPLSDFIFLGTDSEQYPIQDFQPNKTKEQLITATSVTIDMSTWVHWEVYCSVESVFYNLISTTVTGIGMPIPSNTWFGLGVYHGTVKTGAVPAFTNISTTGTCKLLGM